MAADGRQQQVIRQAAVEAIIHQVTHQVIHLVALDEVKN
jgi:hypothetical protein